MITISGKNFSFQSSNFKDSISIKISSAGSVQFNNLVSQLKNQLADKSGLPKGKPSQDALPPRAIEPLPEPKGNIPRDIVRVPSLDNIQFVETDLSRELKAEAAGGFDDDLISLTGIQPEVASEPQLEVPKGIIPGDAQPPKFPTVINELGEPLFEIPEQIILGDALPPPPGGFQVLPSTKPAETGKPEQIVLGDALDPPNGEFQVLGSNPRPEFIPAEEIIRADALEPLNQVVNVGPTITPSEDVIRNDALEPLNQSFDLKPAEEAKSSIFNFVVSNK